MFEHFNKNLILMAVCDMSIKYDTLGVKRPDRQGLFLEYNGMLKLKDLKLGGKKHSDFYE